MTASVRAGAAVVAALRAGGVQHIVVAPGSRSAPVARAAAAAEAAGDLDLHVRLDERSAGFLALGLAKASGSPAAVVCTSGTAVANLFPAVVEARNAGVPLAVITTDRPPDRRGRGAPQTIDQVDIFGRYPLLSVDLPLPLDDDWSAAAVTDFTLAASRMRGPVHLNLPLRPPLVGPVPEVVAPVPKAADLDAVPPVELPGAARGAVLVGDLDVRDDELRAAVLALASDHGWPVIAEASSGLLGAPGVVDGSTAALSDPAFRARVVPDLLLTVGPFGLTRGVMAWVTSAKRHVSVRVRPRTDPPDPLDTAEAILPTLPRFSGVRRDPDWSVAWELPLPVASEWGLDRVAAEVWAALTPDDLLLVAASRSIRELAAVATGSGPRVIANRGANGIDGLVSTAWGAADVWPGRTVALLGDLALLHDTNGLLVPTTERRPDLTYVVADDNGGGIFSTLEQGDPRYSDTFDRVFGTPHDRDLAALLELHGVPTTRVADATALARALRRPGGSSGAGVAAVLAELPPRSTLTPPGPDSPPTT